MKKELCAAALLILLTVCAWLNVRHIDRLTDSVASQLVISQAAAERGDLEGALAGVEEGLRIWQGEAQYAAIFMNHRDADAIQDTISHLQELLLQGDAAGAQAAYRQLIDQLKHISDMERPSVGSIL